MEINSMKKSFIKRFTYWRIIFPFFFPPGLISTFFFCFVPAPPPLYLFSQSISWLSFCATSSHANKVYMFLKIFKIFFFYPQVFDCIFQWSFKVFIMKFKFQNFGNNRMIVYSYPIESNSTNISQEEVS